MEYLKDLGFSEYDISDIKNSNYSYIVENLELNSNNIIDIVKYLFEIGIEKNTIKQIFIDQVNFLFKTKNEIKTSFDEYEIDSIVKSLNFDANNIELIDFI
ncbi:MAG: hypothetical protein IJ068_05115 [Bacilli bacterium]|nr:hypothetical protein [Bacilli bacterium]